MAYNIPRPVAIAQPSYLGGASPLASGIQSGVQLAGMLQQQDARAKQMQMQDLQLQQAQQQMTEQEAKSALGSVAQGAEDVLAIQGATPQETQTARYNYLANRLDQLRAQGKNTEQTDEALIIGLNEGFDSPAFDQAMGEAVQIANSFGVFTPRQQMEREQAAKLAAQKGEKAFDRAKGLRKEYNDASKDFFKVRDAKARIEASVEEPDATGDIALIFNYMKMLDPGSTVREGEYATASQAGGVDSAVLNIYNRLISGERLQPEQRNMFSSRASKLFKKAETQNKKDLNDVLRVGRQYGLTKSDIFGQDEHFAVASMDQVKEEYPSQPEANAQDMTGFVLMEDANGNRAMVNEQTGEVKEL